MDEKKCDVPPDHFCAGRSLALPDEVNFYCQVAQTPGPMTISDGEQD